MCSSVPASLLQRSPLENPRTSEAQARSGPGRNTGDTSRRLAINCHSAMKPAATAKLATRQSRSSGAVHALSPLSAARPNRRLLRDNRAGVQRVADDADPDQIGQHQVRAQRLLRQHDAGAQPERIDRDLDRDGDDQRDAGRQAERHEDARQRRRDDDLADPLRRRTAAARAIPPSAAARCCAPPRGSGSGSARRRRTRRSRSPCDSRSRARSARSAAARWRGSAGSPRP